MTKNSFEIYNFPIDFLPFSSAVWDFRFGEDFLFFCIVPRTILKLAMTSEWRQQLTKGKFSHSINKIKFQIQIEANSICSRTSEAIKDVVKNLTLIKFKWVLQFLLSSSFITHFSNIFDILFYVSFAGWISDCLILLDYSDSQWVSLLFLYETKQKWKISFHQIASIVFSAFSV